MHALALTLLLAVGGDPIVANVQPGDWGRIPPEYPGGPSERCQWQEIKSESKSVARSLFATAITILTHRDSYNSYSQYERARVAEVFGHEVNERVFTKGRMICVTREQRNMRIAPIEDEPIFITD